MHEYLQQLLAQIHELYGRSNTLAIELHCKDVHLDLNIAVPCGIIINELITNACKHAFPEGRSGLISIRLSQNNGDDYTLCISDNGTGLPEGFSIDNASSLGLTLVMMLSKQIGGKLTAAREDNTTCFTVNFKGRKK